MDLAFPPPPTALRSLSQIARVFAEHLAVANFYCAACGTSLTAYSPSTKVYDFCSAECKEKFQLKPASHWCGFEAATSGRRPLISIQRICQSSIESVLQVETD